MQGWRGRKRERGKRMENDNEERREGRREGGGGKERL